MAKDNYKATDPAEDGVGETSGTSRKATPGKPSKKPAKPAAKAPAKKTNPFGGKKK